MTNVRQFDRSGNDENDPPGPTFRRTRRGSEELVTRSKNLASGQRQVLLFANGRRSVEELMNRVPEIQDNPDILFAMESEGLIEMFDADLNEVVESNRASGGEQPVRLDKPSTASEPNVSDNLGQTKRSIEADLYDLLGRDANVAIAKLQAIDSAEELETLMPKLLKLVKLSGGVKSGERFVRKYTEWLG